MELQGIMSGKRQGRRRFLGVVGNTDEKLLQVSNQDYELD